MTEDFLNPELKVKFDSSKTSEDKLYYMNTFAKVVGTDASVPANSIEELVDIAKIFYAEYDRKKEKMG